MKNAHIKNTEISTEAHIKKCFDINTEHDDNIIKHPITNYKNAVVVTTATDNRKTKGL